MGRFSKAKTMLWMPLALGLAVACGDQPVENAVEELGVVARMDVVAGDAQTGEVGTQLSNPLVVRVSDALGRPVQNQIVNFRVTEGGGSVFAGAAITDAQGRAQEWWTLGDGEGDNKVEARAVDTASGEKVVFARFSAKAVKKGAPVEEEPTAPVEEEPDTPVEEEPSVPVEEEPATGGDKGDDSSNGGEEPEEPAAEPEPEAPAEAPSTAWTRGKWEISGGGLSAMLDLDARTITLPGLGTVAVTRSVSGDRLNVSFTVPKMGAASMALQHRSGRLEGTARVDGRSESVVARRPAGSTPTEPSQPVQPQQPEPQPQEPAPPPSPAQPGDRANEPAGFTRVAERSFASLDENGWNDQAPPATSGTRASFGIVSDPTAPTKDGRVGRVTFPAGLTGEGSSSRQIRSTYQVGTPDRLYMSFWFKLSDNWYGHTGAGVNKVFYVGHPLVIDAHGSGNSPIYLQLSLQGGENFNGRWNAAENEVRPTASQAELVRGRWHHVEVLIEANTPGQYNGRMHAWVNGVKTHQFSNRRILSGGNDRYSEFGNLHWHPIYGGQNGQAVPATQYQYIDHIYVSRR